MRSESGNDALVTNSSLDDPDGRRNCASNSVRAFDSWFLFLFPSELHCRMGSVVFGNICFGLLASSRVSVRDLHKAVTCTDNVASVIFFLFRPQSTRTAAFSPRIANNKPYKNQPTTASSTGHFRELCFA